MPFNKQRGNMYFWVTHTWNPIRGCKHDCKYCYMKSLKGYSMEPRLITKQLCSDLGNGKTIFVSSSGDMFGVWIPQEWFQRVLQHCRKFDNTYLFQSKNPQRFLDHIDEFPELTILGTTIETNRHTASTSKAPYPIFRMKAMKNLGQRYTKIISIEPILDFDIQAVVNWIRQIRPLFVSIGADSKEHCLLEPSTEKIRELIVKLRKSTEIRIKPNLGRLGLFE